MTLRGGAVHSSDSSVDPARAGQILDTRPKLDCPTPDAEEILRRATSQELDEANLRYLIISGLAPVDQIKGSWQSHYRWKRSFREAEQRLGCGLVGLLQKYRNCGRKPAYPKEIVDLADQMITEHFFGVKSKSKIATYGMIALACERRGLPVPSIDWVRRRIAQLLSQQRATMRQRAVEPLISEERIITQGDSLHGERPWDNVQIDHHLCDIELVCSQTGLPLGRPWLSLMLDGFSRRVLALVLTFDKPSYRALLLLMRECVRKHGRLPDAVTADGGSDFTHTFIESLCARFNVIIKRRPATRKSFGTLIERLFGTLGTQFFQNLSGCTRPFRDAPRPTVTDAAREHAVWTLEDIHELLTQFFFEIYDDRLHPGLIDTPRQAYERGMEQSGLRQTRQIVYDDKFIAMTMPTTLAGTAQVKEGVGVRINYIDYWCDEMQCPNLVGLRLPVRYDPWNLAVAWVYLAGEWHRCVSVFAASFQGRSEKELMLASMRIVKSKSQVTRNSLITAKKLAEFFESAEVKEKLKKQRLQDQAQKRALERSQVNVLSDAAYEI